MQKAEPVARCRISIADLRHTPNEAVLVTKCLTVADPATDAAADPGAAAALQEDSDSDESETSTAHSTRSGAAPPTPPQVPFATVSRGFASGRSLPCPASGETRDRNNGNSQGSATMSGAAPQPTAGSPPQATAGAARPPVSQLPQGAWMTLADPAPGVSDGAHDGVAAAAAQQEIHRAASVRAHMPPGAVAAAVGSVDGSAAAQAHPLHNSACGSAMTGYGSLASDAKPPEHVQASGWLMFEVRAPTRLCMFCMRGLHAAY